MHLAAGDDFLLKRLCKPRLDGINQGLDEISFDSSQIVHDLGSKTYIIIDIKVATNLKFSFVFRYFQNLFHFTESYFKIFFKRIKS